MFYIAIAILISAIISNLQNRKIIMNQQELAQELTNLQTQLSKVNAEVQTKLQELEDALNNDGEVSPEVQSAFDGLKASIQGVDDLIPDTTEPGEGDE